MRGRGHAARARPRRLRLYQGDFLDGFVVAGAAVRGVAEAVNGSGCGSWSFCRPGRAEPSPTSAGPGLTTRRRSRRGSGLLALDPLQEPVHRTLMRLYAQSGRRGAALRQYQACVAALQRELGRWSPRWRRAPSTRRSSGSARFSASKGAAIHRRSRGLRASPQCPHGSSFLSPVARRPPLAAVAAELGRSPLRRPSRWSRAGAGSWRSPSARPASERPASGGRADGGGGAVGGAVARARRPRLRGRSEPVARPVGGRAPLRPRHGRARDRWTRWSPRWRDELGRLLPELSRVGEPTAAIPGAEIAGRSGGDPRYPFEAISELLKRLDAAAGRWSSCWRTRTGRTR